MTYLNMPSDLEEEFTYTSNVKLKFISGDEQLGDNFGSDGFGNGSGSGDGSNYGYGDGFGNGLGLYGNIYGDSYQQFLSESDFFYRLASKP
jgi:hypothetical protein